MQIDEHKLLSDMTTMRIGGEARYFMEATTKHDIADAIAWARDKNLPFKVIGEGSNLIVTDEGYSGLIISNRLKGVAFTPNGDGTVTVVCGSGEAWDTVVEQTTVQGLTGIEALSLIPGTTGATPVQNVGAYGQEVADTIREVEVYDTVTQNYTSLSNQECEFGYRDSIFKHGEKNRYVITAVTFILRPGSIEPPLYESLQRYLDEHTIVERTPEVIRSAVIAIRSSKLPDPATVANTGSFFKNPIVSHGKYEALQHDYPAIPGYPVVEGVKVPAGWLIEQAGFKDYIDPNGMGTYVNHSLVIVNNSATTFAALAELQLLITSKVNEIFGITLEQEPETLMPS